MFLPVLLLMSFGRGGGGGRRRGGEEERVSLDSTGEDDVGETYLESNIELFDTTQQKRERRKLSQLDARREKTSRRERRDATHSSTHEHVLAGPIHTCFLLDDSFHQRMARLPSPQRGGTRLETHFSQLSRRVRMTLRRLEEERKRRPNDISLSGQEEKPPIYDMPKERSHRFESALSCDGGERKRKVEWEEDSDVVDEGEVEFDDADETV